MKMETSTQPCSRCGAAEAVPCADVWICLDCYAASGSCCAEWPEIAGDEESLSQVN
jgi:hypothetical protein